MRCFTFPDWILYQVYSSFRPSVLYNYKSQVCIQISCIKIAKFWNLPSAQTDYLGFIVWYKLIKFLISIFLNLSIDMVEIVLLTSCEIWAVY